MEGERVAVVFRIEGRVCRKHPPTLGAADRLTKVLREESWGNEPSIQGSASGGKSELDFAL
jgi:hypothetical protein